MHPSGEVDLKVMVAKLEAVENVGRSLEGHVTRIDSTILTTYGALREDLGKCQEAVGKVAAVEARVTTLEAALGPNGALSVMLSNFATNIQTEMQAMRRDMQNGFQAVRLEMETGFKAVNERLDKVEGRMDKLEGRMDRLEGRMDKLEGRMDKLEGRMDKLEGRMDKLEGGMDGLEGRMDGLEGKVTDMQTCLGGLVGSLTKVDKTVSDIDVRTGKTHTLMELATTLLGLAKKSTSDRLGVIAGSIFDAYNWWNRRRQNNAQVIPAEDAAHLLNANFVADQWLEDDMV